MLPHTIFNPNETPRNNETETGKLVTSQKIEYKSPQVIAVGKAIDMLQGGTGKHYDGYTGYYWNEEG